MFRLRPAAASASAGPDRCCRTSIGAKPFWLLQALALAAAFVAGPGNAQLSGSASIVSDYRFRGVTLSDEAPALQAALLYDHVSGFYVGGFVSTVRIAPANAAAVQGIGQAGYALRGPGNLSYDIGALYSDFSRPTGLGYADFYIGAAASEWSARLWHAPRYFGQPYSASYAEINLTPALEGPWAPLLHAGWLAQRSGAQGGPQSRWDARVGLAYNFELATAQLSWVTASRGASTFYEQHRSRWVLKVTTWLP